jgi:hypothetical protein
MALRGCGGNSFALFRSNHAFSPSKGLAWSRINFFVVGQDSPQYCPSQRLIVQSGNEAPLYGVFPFFRDGIIHTNRDNTHNLHNPKELRTKEIFEYLAEVLSEHNCL